MAQSSALPRHDEQLYIMVIEGSTEIRFLLRRRLQQAGYAVDAFETANQAVEFLVQGGRPHLILLDLPTPDSYGFAAAEELQRLSNAPIIVLSTQTDSRTKVEALHRFAEDYVAKPFDFAELLARIRRVLARYSKDGD